MVFGSKVDNLETRVFATREEMGRAAGSAISSKIKALMNEQNIVRIVFGAAPSQNEVLAYLATDKTIDWSRIDAFHMDEYIGLPAKAPQRFASFLYDHIWNIVHPRNVYIIDDSKGVTKALEEYKTLIAEAPIDIICLGVGENGHIAFNDPPVADFNDPEIVKLVELDLACRNQQVNDGCFPGLGDVPEKAITLTIPTMMSGRYLFCVVPGPTKKHAIKDMLLNEISTACPASILRTHDNCILFVDQDAFSLMP